MFITIPGMNFLYTVVSLDLTYRPLSFPRKEYAFRLKACFRDFFSVTRELAARTLAHNRPFKLGWFVFPLQST